MTTSFLRALEREDNTTLTANGAVTNRSTLDANLDFFSRGGALRSNPNEFVSLFRKAYAEDRLTAVRTLFYLRDVRGGQGERNLFRAGLRELRRLDFNTFQMNIPVVATYGRWDDLIEFDDIAVKNTLLIQFLGDLDSVESGHAVSLLGKWLPSENASSKATKARARELIRWFGLSNREYRKSLVALRKAIGILEQKMSSKEWSEINYEHLPSQAHRKHVKAFMRNDEDRYTAYLSAVEAGEKKINTSTLYTYEVYDLLLNGQTQAAAEAMWANLPDYTNGSDSLVVADVSGSMYGRPMSISVSLALYFAERNQGRFKDYFITFSEKPKLQKISGNSLQQKMVSIENADWGMSTNLEAVFDLILDAACKDQLPQSELPKVVYVISDMEFNRAVKNPNASIFQNARANFIAAGYELPHVVFWNVNSWTPQVPATAFDEGVTLISGASQSTFAYVMEGKTPVELMNEVVHGVRYLPVRLANG